MCNSKNEKKNAGLGFISIFGGDFGYGFWVWMYVCSPYTKTLNNKKVLKKQQQKKLLRVDIF